MFVCFFLCPLLFLSYQLHWLKVWDTWLKKKTQCTHHYVDFGFLASLPSSLYLWDSSYICFMYSIQGFYFYLYLAGKVGKIMSILSPWKQKSLQRLFRYSLITKYEILLIRSPTLLSYERTPLLWLPIMLKKLFCLNKIILRKDILEGLFNHFLLNPSHSYLNSLTNTTLLFSETSWFEVWDSLVSLLIFKLLEARCF